MKVSFNSAGSLHKTVGDGIYEDIWYDLKCCCIDRMDCAEAFEAFKSGNYSRAEKLLPKDVLKDLLWEIENTIGHMHLAKALTRLIEKEAQKC